jgi:hypothetical protein
MVSTVAAPGRLATHSGRSATSDDLGSYMSTIRMRKMFCAEIDPECAVPIEPCIAEGEINVFPTSK